MPERFPCRGFLFGCWKSYRVLYTIRRTFFPISIAKKWNVFTVMIWFCCVMAVHDMNGQNGFVAVGGDIATSNGSIAYSIGQPFWECKEGDTYKVFEGLQQPFEWYIVTHLNAMGAHPGINMFPNPAGQGVYLKVDSVERSLGFEYKIFNSSGMLVARGQFFNTEHFIDIDGWPPGSYFVALLKDSKPVFSGQFVKN